MKKFSAFTLAEVLIVLGIIGVVSAMTLPALISNYQKSVLVNQLRKDHSLLSQAFELMMQEEKVVNFSETDFWMNCLQGDSSSMCSNALKKYIKTSFGPSYYSSSISYYTLSCSWFGYYSNCSKSNNTRSDYTRGNIVTLPSGSTVYLNNDLVTIDVNGLQKPNTYGRDLFTFWVDANSGELIPNDFAGPGAGQIIKDGWEMKY